MNIASIFKPKNTPVNFVVNNHDVKAKIQEFIESDLDTVNSVIIIFEDDKKQTFWKCAGIEPAQAILALDQLHHRIQHEGLKNYD